MKKIGQSHLVGSESKQDKIDPVVWLKNLCGTDGPISSPLDYPLGPVFIPHIESWSLASNNLMLKVKFKGKQNYYKNKSIVEQNEQKCNKQLLKMYFLWFNLNIGLNFVSFCFNGNGNSIIR